MPPHKNTTVAGLARKIRSALMCLADDKAGASNIQNWDAYRTSLKVSGLTALDALVEHAEALTRKIGDEEKMERKWARIDSHAAEPAHESVQERDRPTPDPPEAGHGPPPGDESPAPRRRARNREEFDRRIDSELVKDGRPCLASDDPLLEALYREHQAPRSDLFHQPLKIPETSRS